MLTPRNDIVYGSTKTYVHSVGLSCVFRQWRAQSHCRFLHGYAIKVKCVFETTQLDERNWAVDFGSLKSFKGWLEDMFDHKMLVAEDDPHRGRLEALSVSERLADIRIVPATGCEAMSRMIFEYLECWLVDNGYSPRVKLTSVEVAEHAGNSAYTRLKGDGS